MSLGPQSIVESIRNVDIDLLAGITRQAKSVPFVNSANWKVSNFVNDGFQVSTTHLLSVVLNLASLRIDKVRLH